MDSPDPEWASLVGAFAHEIRTPLTAATMVMQLAASGKGGAIELDAELAGMLNEALGNIRLLTDQLQDASRFVRRAATLDLRPVDVRQLAAAVVAAASVDVTPETPPDVSGRWDAGRLVAALAALAGAADRIGASDGKVQFRIVRGDPVTFEFVSGTGAVTGEPGMDATTVSTLGFEYYAARVMVQAMGGDVGWGIGPGTGRVRATLPTS